MGRIIPKRGVKRENLSPLIEKIGSRAFVRNCMLDILEDLLF